MTEPVHQPVKITLRQAAELIEDAAAVVFDHMALAWISVHLPALDEGDPEALWIEYEHEDEEGLCYTFNFDCREQEIILRGSDIELLDAQGEPSTISLYTRWLPEPTPRRSVGVLLAKPDGSGLWLSERLAKDPPTQFDGCIATPGGKVDPGESLEEALRRETREEAGISLVELDYVEDGIYEGSLGRYHGYHYFATTDEVPQDMEPSKHGPWTYYRTEQLLDLSLMQSTRNAICKAINIGWLKVVTPEKDANRS